MFYQAWGVGQTLQERVGLWRKLRPVRSDSMLGLHPNKVDLELMEDDSISGCPFMDAPVESDMKKLVYYMNHGVGEWDGGSYRLDPDCQLQFLTNVPGAFDRSQTEQRGEKIPTKPMDLLKWLEVAIPFLSRSAVPK